MILILGHYKDNRPQILSNFIPNAKFVDPTLENITKIEEIDGVICYYPNYTIVKYFECLNILVANPVDVTLKLSDKYLSYILFRNYVPCIERELIVLNKKEKEKSISEDYEKVINSFSYPVVLKHPRTSLGNFVIKCNDKQSLISVLDTLSKFSKTNTLTIERFIHHTYDVRALCTWDGKVWLMKRVKKPEEFRSNIAKGGRPEKYENKELEEISIKIMEKSKAVFLGIDFLPENNKFLLNEINTFPGFEGIVNIYGTKFLKDFILSIYRWFKQ